jgi:hypothetical protein
MRISHESGVRLVTGMTGLGGNFGLKNERGGRILGEDS